jgi:hypothetical protein
MKAPPYMSIVAASGTKSTLYPIYFKCRFNVAKAVVLPAQGPPVKQMRVTGHADTYYLYFAEATIGSSSFAPACLR